MKTNLSTSVDPTDSITISTIGQRIELRIDAPDRGVTRIAMLTVSEARKLAEALTTHADALTEANKAKKEREDRLKADGLKDLF